MKNKMNKLNKKADLAVTLLIFMAVALAAATLFIFIISSGKIEAKIVDARFLDKVYLKEEQINFYINEVMDKAIQAAIEETKENNNFEESFKANFLAELDKYKINDKFILEELQQVRAQFYENSNVFVFEKDTENAEKVKKVTAEFEITITETGDPFSAVYTYTKKFEKEVRENVEEESSASVSPPATSVVSADLTQKSRIPGSNTVYDGYYINVNGEKTEYFLIETLNGYTVMKEGSGDYYALIEKDEEWRIVTYPNRPLPEYLQGKKFVKEDTIIYFKEADEKA